MSTPSAEDEIMELQPEDVRAVLLLLARRYPFEVGQAIASVTGKRS
jgi:hypothetical protein